MQIEVPFPPGTNVWVWNTMVGREPLQTRIATVNVWIDDRGTTMFYTFTNDLARSFVVDVGETIFTTREEAVASRKERIASLAASMTGQKSP